MQSASAGSRERQEAHLVGDGLADGGGWLFGRVESDAGPTLLVEREAQVASVKFCRVVDVVEDRIEGRHRAEEQVFGAKSEEALLAVCRRKGVSCL